MDFSVEDRVDPHAFNHILWQGLMGSKAYSTVASGVDLRAHREPLLEAFRKTQAAGSSENPKQAGGGTR